LGSLLASTAPLYLWNLSASGYRNTFYAAAAHAARNAGRPGSSGRSTTPAAVRSSTVTGASMNDVATNSQLARLLAATHTPWSAATNGSQSAATLEISSSTAMMAVGGWSGDPVPTLQQFIDDVHAGKISYYIAAHYPGTMIGGSTVYRLA
jgi:hypothetical protein